jgi:hypothetical protein
MESESSCTSSQLDDIDLVSVDPRKKVYEHQTDVGSLFKDTRAQQFRPEMGANYEQIPSHAVHSIPARDIGEDLPDMQNVALEPREMSSTADIHSQGRIRHNSGAAPDLSAAQMHHVHRTSLQSSDTSDVRFMQRRESCGNATVNVDLLSPAFVLNEHAWQQGALLGLSPAEIVSQRAVTGLGVDHGAIKFYQLNEVQAHELRAPGRYAVHVERSGA